MGERKQPSPAPGEPGYRGPRQVKPTPPPAPPRSFADLADRIEEIPPALRLILAAGLIDSGAVALARIVIAQVLEELTVLQKAGT